MTKTKSNTLSVPVTAIAAAVRSAGSIKAMQIVVGDLKVDIPANEVADAMEAMSVTAESRRKWKDAESEVSARFGAPACYEANQPLRKALTDFLTRVHPLYASLESAEQKIVDAEKAPMGISPTKAQITKKKDAIRLAKAERNLLLIDIERSVAYGIGSLKDEYEAGLNPDERGKKSEGPSVLELCTKMAAQMNRRAKSDKIPSADLTIAVFISRVCILMQRPERAEFIRAATQLLPLDQPAMAQKVDHTAVQPGKVEQFTAAQVDTLNKAQQQGVPAGKTPAPKVSKAKATA